MKKEFWYLFAIEIIDTQVARRGRQYHSQPTCHLIRNVSKVLYKKQAMQNKIKNLPDIARILQKASYIKVRKKKQKKKKKKKKKQNKIKNLPDIAHILQKARYIQIKKKKQKKKQRKNKKLT